MYRFDLDYDEVVVLETAVARKASKEILEQHGIPESKSVGCLPEVCSAAQKTAVVEVENFSTTAADDTNKLNAGATTTCNMSKLNISTQEEDAQEVKTEWIEG